MRQEHCLYFLIVITVVSKLLMSRFHLKIEATRPLFEDINVRHQISPNNLANVHKTTMLGKSEVTLEDLDSTKIKVFDSELRVDMRAEDNVYKANQQMKLPNFSGLEVRQKIQSSTTSSSSSNTPEIATIKNRNVVAKKEKPVLYDNTDLGSGHFKTIRLGDRDKKKFKKKVNQLSADKNPQKPSLPDSIPDPAASSITLPLPSSSPQLPPYDMSDDSSGKGLVIYFDWPHPSSKFALLNYKSLESFLHVYPAASFRCILFAPVYALNYKFANALSVQQFQK
jgi:hypothetical protein